MNNEVLDTVDGFNFASVLTYYFVAVHAIFKHDRFHNTLLGIKRDTILDECST